MLFMVIEHFKNRDAKAVYLRAQEQGRMLPEGLAYVGSWVEDTFDRCFQVMECEVRVFFSSGRFIGRTSWHSKSSMLCHQPRREMRLFLGRTSHMWNCDSHCPDDEQTAILG
jgi:hypothetical protein